MFLVLTWIYTIIMAIVWWFFIIAKIHYYKFKDYSNYIVPVTKFLSILLLVLTIFWYYEVYKFSFSGNTSTTTVQQDATNNVY